MFYRKCGCFKNNNNCPSMHFDECDIETKCNNVNNYSNYEADECSCGYDEEFNGFPEYPMYAQSYVPIQQMNKVFKPEVGLKKGTIFPELVSPYCPNQSVEEIEYIKMTNKIGEGCNK